jgi:insertion element IS1 protein InsB
MLLYCTDNYAPYTNALPIGCHPGGKDFTYQIEQNNSRPRHWFARFTRKSVVVTRSLLMRELTRCLFATFHVNGTDALLLNQASYMIS